MNTFLLHPAFFPPVAYYAAIVQSEKLLFEAYDNYQKQTYRNRLYLYASNGKQTLTVPIKHTHSSGRQLYRDVKIENDLNWQKQHWKTLQTAYRTSPFFEFYEEDIAPLFHEKQDTLFDLNLKSIELVAACLQYELKYDFTEAYQKDYGKELNDFRYLVNAKNSPALNFEPYTQVFSQKFGFMENLSILDLLFNMGPQTLDFLEAQKLS